MDPGLCFAGFGLEFARVSKPKDYRPQRKNMSTPQLRDARRLFRRLFRRDWAIKARSARDADQLAKLIDAQGGRLAKPRREALR
jgi:hypothetical protein